MRVFFNLSEKQCGRVRPNILLRFKPISGNSRTNVPELRHGRPEPLRTGLLYNLPNKDRGKAFESLTGQPFFVSQTRVITTLDFLGKSQDSPSSSSSSIFFVSLCVPEAIRIKMTLEDAMHDRNSTLLAGLLTGVGSSTVPVFPAALSEGLGHTIKKS